MSFSDTLFSIFKSANPEASDDDIRSHIDSMQASPDQMGSALAPFTPPTGELTDVKGDEVPPLPTDVDLSPKFPSANDAKSSFDVGVSDNTVTMNGRPDSLPANEPPLDTSAPSKVAEQPEVPATEEPAAPVAAPAVPSKPAAKAAPSDDSALKALVSPDKKDTGDADLLAAQRRKHNLGLIPVTAAGIGDAISSAASAFGANGVTGAQGKVEQGINDSIKQDKVAFEDKQRKDPASDVSRHYQKVLGLMLGKHAEGMGVEKMSAENIAATLPEVEKYMQKELGLKQIQATKEQTSAFREQGRQDKLEKDGREWYDNLSKARNGELGAQNQKVDQARHLLQLYKQSEDTGQPLTNAQYGELAIGAANLIAGGGQHVSDHTRDLIMQSTAKGDLNKAFTYAGFNPSTLGGTTDAIAKNLKDTIIRQGLEAQTQRDKFIEDHKATMPSGLSPEQAKRITSVDLGNRIDDLLPKKGAVARHPQDQAALDWAKANSNDPRAAKILKANGF